MIKKISLGLTFMVMAYGGVHLGAAEKTQARRPAPRAIFLNFTDATWVFFPSSKSFNLVAEGKTISHTTFWQTHQMGPHLYHLKSSGARTHFFILNSRTRKFFVAHGMTFGTNEDVGTTQLRHVIVNVVGGSKHTPPTRISMRLRRCALLLSPRTNGVDLKLSRDYVLDICRNWEMCRVTSNTYHVKSPLFKGYFWKVNTLRNKAYKVKRGRFCRMRRGRNTPLNAEVDVRE